MGAHISTASLLLLILIHVSAIAFNKYERGVLVMERMLPALSADKLINRTPIVVQMSIACGLLISIELLTGMHAIVQYREAASLNANFQTERSGRRVSPAPRNLGWPDN